jgi:hypothetical protein
MTLFAAMLMGHRIYREWFVATYPGYYVHTVSYSLSNGDTIDEVANYFDRINHVTEHDKSTVLEIWKSRGWEIRERDEILHFSVKQGHGRWCHFRNGRLINHEQPQDPVRVMALNNQPCPPWFLRWF